MTKVSAVMRWVGPAAIAGATFAVTSDQLGLVTHLPDLGADAAGYHAVGSGLFLFVSTLLLVGMLGLYAGRPADGPTVIEYGDGHARYVLVEAPEVEVRSPTNPPGHVRPTVPGAVPGDEARGGTRAGFVPPRFAAPQRGVAGRCDGPGGAGNEAALEA